MVHNKITVHGEVQGVFFRAGAKKIADELGITGWVKNLPDGTVAIEAEGSEEQLTKLLSWCNRGTERAHVERVEYEPGELIGYQGFEIR